MSFRSCKLADIALHVYKCKTKLKWKGKNENYFSEFLNLSKQFQLNGRREFYCSFIFYFRFSIALNFFQFTRKRKSFNEIIWFEKNKETKEKGWTAFLAYFSHSNLFFFCLWCLHYVNDKLYLQPPFLYTIYLWKHVECKFIKRDIIIREKGKRQWKKIAVSKVRCVKKFENICATNVLEKNRSHE